MAEKFVLLQDRFEHVAGTEVYQYSGHTYGLVREDAEVYGTAHTAVTLNPDGSGPFFTVPIKDLEPV